jgi:membrane protein
MSALAQISPEEHADPRGRAAGAPNQIPAAGWGDIAKRVLVRIRQDNLTLIAGGVAFYSLLSVLPAFAAVVAIYGLVADPADISRQVASVGAVPPEARDLLTSQLTDLTSQRSGLGMGLAIALVLALWAASTAVKQLIVALSATYKQTETRGYVKLRAMAAGFTIAGIISALFVVALLTAVPTWVQDHVGEAAAVAVSIVRWPILAAVMLGALAALYRFAPDRPDPRWRWVSPGALLATGSWLIGSVLFSAYVTHFGSYNKTYGTLGAVVVFMLWLLITALCCLLGAEVNSECERQTTVDTTTGPDQHS